MFLWDTIPPSWSPGFHIKSLFLDPTKQTNKQTIKQRYHTKSTRATNGEVL